MKCPYCDQDHPLTEKQKNYADYYIGVEHIKQTGEILVYEGYDWVKPEEAGDFPGGKVIIVQDFDPRIKLGDFRWDHWHGFSGAWFEVKELPVYKGTYAIQ